MGAIRLAEARGILSDGRSLSRVQQRALELLVLDRVRSDGERTVEDIKMALLTHNPASAPKLWPQWFPHGEEKTVETVDEVDEALEEVDAEYHFDTTEAPEDMQALIDKLSIGSMSLTEDLDDGWQ